MKYIHTAHLIFYNKDHSYNFILRVLARSRNFRREFNAICVNAVELHSSCQAVIVSCGGKDRINLVGLLLIYPLKIFLEPF
jgi:hypothetical protein